MAFKFEKLEVWKMGIAYANEVQLLTEVIYMKISKLKNSLE